ncbi:hypothetical protein HG263_06255 [Pseudoalteromonas sp. JBTF-M23]|uniref:ABC-type transport auxiliary lipoprotein component domain-containing protein n=1 Tax=Pseudoalteromonas caenipelagi TaxID=2726988 RepID=A0A849V9U7_9GAMM|nr:ABC-type transport auxiliary lipoprotein family protein [Pseudoalteromonas caenipelagi]NOU50142.1 hypothetical protein [Pseudoalteromonas caenipelagi]
MRIIGGCLIALLLVACSTASHNENNYYTFSIPLAQKHSSQAKDSNLVLMLDQVKVVGVGDQQGIVQLLEQNRVSVAQSHFWAEHPRYMLSKTLLTTLQNDLPQWHVMNANAPAPILTPLVVSVEVSDLAGHYQSGALISGHWFIYQQTEQGRELLTYKPFSLSTELNDNGFTALVEALQMSWLNLAQQIVLELNQYTKSPNDKDSIL